METHHTFCRICEALCGLEVDVEEGRAVAIRPDPAHVATEGFACLKGLKQHRLYGSPDRLTHPQRRVGERWETVGWDDALHRIGDRVRDIVRRHGPNAVAMYVGTAAGFSVLHPVFAQGFMMGLGSRSMYSSSTQDCANKFAVSRAMYGFPFTLPFPDVAQTRCLVVVGANPLVSKWSFLQVPNPARHLKDIEARGGKVWVVDPRRTETAKSAGEHVFIRPNTDVFFYLAFLHELIAREARGEVGLRAEAIAAHTRGFDAVRALVAPWSPERCAEVTRVAPEVLRRIVGDFARADGAALYASTGVNMGEHGSLAFWLQEVINAVTGNLDRPGGTLVGEGIFDFPAFGKKTGALLRDDRSRVGDYPSVNDGFPGGLLADEILTEGPGQVKALFVTGGNPLITMPNAGRLRDALTKLDLLVTVDVFRNETGSLAHYILPATSPMQRADLPFVFPLWLGMQARPYLQATRAVLPPEGEQRDEATIYLDLCRACGVDLFGSKAAQLAMEAMAEFRSPRGVPQELLLSAMLRATGHGSFDALASEGHGRLRPPHRAGSFLGARVHTPDARVDLAPAGLVAEAERTLEAFFAAEHRDRRRLKLITRRAVTTHNSWTHNDEAFVGSDRNTNHLYLHPDDAARLGLADGDLADVTSDTATVRVPVKTLADLMPGVVALPHGWGHQHATGLRVASRTEGVNVNLLAADGPGRLERVSGMAHLTGFNVDVAPAAGPRNTASWSGI
jgi:formate dehydrogenase